ncbi:MAG: hypothetical protein ACLPYW_09265 [Acidimicrobiales bacterium]
MTNTTDEVREDGPSRVIESVQDAEHTALEAVRKFVDAVDGVFPDVSADSGARRKIIDSAFKMTEELVGASNKLAQKVVKVTESMLADLEKSARTPEK